MQRPNRMRTMMLKAYMEQINFPLLTAQEEQEFARRVQSGDKTAINKLVIHNLRLVVNIAKKLPFKDLEEKICNGNMALLRAARSFKPGFGRFSTYATWAIRREICDQYWIDNTISLSIHCRSNKPRPQFVRHEISEDIENRNLLAKTDILQYLEGKEAIEALNTLPYINKNEKRIVKMYFGIDNEKSYTLQEIGDKIGRTKERVRQVVLKTVGFLRNKLVA